MKKSKELSKKPVWIRDHITIHRETFNIFGYHQKYPVYKTHNLLLNNYLNVMILKPIKNIFDVFEMYDPASWWGLDWLRDFFSKGGEHLKLVEIKIMIGRINANKSIQEDIAKSYWSHCIIACC